jgi:hypothetical protein
LVQTGILLVLLSAVVYALYLNATKDQDILGEGDMVLDFKFETLIGDTVQLSNFRGKGVFLNFWALGASSVKKKCHIWRKVINNSRIKPWKR